MFHVVLTFFFVSSSAFLMVGVQERFEYCVLRPRRLSAQAQECARCPVLRGHVNLIEERIAMLEAHRAREQKLATTAENEVLALEEASGVVPLERRSTEFGQQPP